MDKNIPAMRDTFFNALYKIAKKDKKVVLLTADCGAPSLDKFKQELSAQYFTVGIAEQNMISIAAGLALEGRIVYAYAIAPFASLRCYEQIKVDLCCMNLPVTVLGIGAGFAYDIMGPTHHATEDISIMRSLPNMTILNPSDSIMAGEFAHLSY
ncbi:MAG TPA: 1-deoxy-D-xylulose-5-phosphate synthase, partial [Candidatus Omnitrophota bacterium]|nr:1-deoxy-D-xylulose-5-phosphate synthase [Candidatus Omnitrophota bacterium]